MKKNMTVITNKLVDKKFCLIWYLNIWLQISIEDEYTNSFYHLIFKEDSLIVESTYGETKICGRTYFTVSITNRLTINYIKIWLLLNI